jgi:hypothetical protein
MPGGLLRTVDPETGAACCAVVDDGGIAAGNACC